MSEVVFQELKALKDTLDKTFISQGGEYDAAHKCVRISQLEQKLTKFTAYEPTRLKHVLLFYHGEFSGGKEGVNLLVNHEELKKEIDSLYQSYNQITFRPQNGVLSISGDEQVIEGELTCEGQSYCYQYGGVHSDFDPPASLEEEHLIATLQEQTFREWIKLIAKFGGTDTNSKDSFYFALFPQKNTLFGITNYGISAAGYVLSFRDCTNYAQQQVTISLYRKDIPRINTICGNVEDEDKQVSIFYDSENRWVEFRGRFGAVVLKETEASVMITNAFTLSGMKSKKTTTVGSKLFDARSFKKRLGQFKNTISDKLVLYQVGSDLKIQDADNFSSYRYANVPIDPNSDPQDWVPCTVQGRMILSFLEALNTQEMTDSRIELEQTQMGDDPTMIIFLKPLDPVVSQYCSGLVYGSLLEYQLDNLDTDD